MNKQWLAIIPVAIIVIAIGAWLALGGPENDNSNNESSVSANEEASNNIATNSSVNSAPQALTNSTIQNNANNNTVSNNDTVSETDGITIEEVAEHNTKSDCWLVIEGNVYDVTKFIPEHPGGDRILQGCGKDATDHFTGKSTLGRVHSAVARATLKKYIIGELAS